MPQQLEHFPSCHWGACQTENNRWSLAGWTNTAGWHSSSRCCQCYWDPSDQSWALFSFGFPIFLFFPFPPSPSSPSLTSPPSLSAIFPFWVAILSLSIFRGISSVRPLASSAPIVSFLAPSAPPASSQPKAAFISNVAQPAEPTSASAQFIWVFPTISFFLLLHAFVVPVS